MNSRAKDDFRDIWSTMAGVVKGCIRVEAWLNQDVSSFKLQIRPIGYKADSLGSRLSSGKGQCHSVEYIRIKQARTVPVFHRLEGVPEVLRNTPYDRDSSCMTYQYGPQSSTETGRLRGSATVHKASRPA
jgi:hypothetical protein